jgi:DNA-binding helix-hairpin-helix protein with protein kinase domain
MSPPSYANAVLHTASGRVTLGPLIAKGGEGGVYDIPAKPNAVAKIYHKAVDADKAAKLDALASMKSESLLSLTAWPTEVLRNNKGEACGFIMPRVTASKDIHALYTPRSRRMDFPQADWRFLIRAAANTARAFAELHTYQCVIGDVNPGGIAITEQAIVRLIDCDSVQISVGSRLFSCEVGTPLFTPPELQNSKTFRGLTRTANHDNFGLAIIIFHLLLLGRHPFAGRFLGPGDMGIEKAITEFRFVYGASAKALQMEPPPAAPSLNTLSPLVGQLIEKAFSRDAVKGTRPTARDWVAALETLETQLKKCGAVSSHYYFNGLSDCPWCRFEAATGAILFNAPSYTVPGGSLFDLAGVWARIVAVDSPGAAPPEPNKDAFGSFKPSSEAASLGRASIGKAFGVFAVVALGLTLLFAFPGGWVLWFFLGISMISGIAQSNPNRQKIMEFEAKHRTAESFYRTNKQRWDREAGDVGFKAKLSELESVRQKWKDLPMVRQQRLQQLQREVEKQQLARFLEKFTIDQATIPGIGASRKAVLQSYNIETAFDISHRMAVPGFGPALKEKLMDWRRDVERKFVFNSSKGVDARDIAALDKDIAEQKQKYERSLFAGAAELTQIRNQAHLQRKALESQVTDAFKVMLQAEADLTAAKR